MGWFNPHRYGWGVDWGPDPDLRASESDLDWRLRLATLAAALVITALLVALCLLLKGG
jgi:hypothetical protein